MATLAHPIAASESRTSAAGTSRSDRAHSVQPDLPDSRLYPFCQPHRRARRLAGVPLASIMVPIAGIIAAAGGLLILLGYRAKVGAWLIVLFLLAVTPLHKFWGVADPMMQQMQLVMFMKNLAMLGGALIISRFGSGPWSVDNRNIEPSGQ